METNLAQTCDRELRRRGAWFINVHGTVTGRRGTPDRVVIYQGVGLTIEYKQPGGRVQPLQAHEMRQVERAGGIAIVACSADDVRNALDAIDLRNAETVA